MSVVTTYATMDILQSIAAALNVENMTITESTPTVLRVEAGLFEVEVQGSGLSYSSTSVTGTVTGINLLYDGATAATVSGLSLPLSSVATILLAGGDDVVETILALAATGNDTFTDLSTGGWLFASFAGNDTLIGQAGNDTLLGGDGNDYLSGGIGADSMKGGLGNDMYLVDNAGDKTVELLDQGTDSVFSSISWALGANVENLTLTGTAAINGTGNLLDNRLVGNAAANVLSGVSGNDTLDGGAGNDTLVGGLGADSMKGGLGSDLYVVDNSGDSVVELAGQGVDTVNASVSWTLGANVERLALTGTALLDGTGNALGNSLVGNVAANVLRGLGGNDTLIGNAGNDTLYGDAGNDTLDGGTGADSMLGGAGDDRYVVDAPGDVVVELAGQGVDTVVASITRALENHVDNLILSGSGNINGTGNALANRITGNSGDNVLTGNAGNDTLAGNGGNDTLLGGSGADLMVGGTGNDIFIVDNVGDKTVELTGQGVDTIQSSVSWTLGGNCEHLVLTGVTDLVGMGNASANRLTGNGGNNTLNGRLGADTMTGGLGNDTYYIDNIGDMIVENAGNGRDVVFSNIDYTLAANVEDLTLYGATAVQGVGNGLGNLLTGNAQANILNGGGGADTLAGAAGKDTLTGGSGADQFVRDTFLGPNQVDTITDFTAGEDKIVLDDDIFSALAVGTITSSMFSKGAGLTTATTMDERLLLNTTTGALYYDSNGSAAGAAAIQIAVIQGSKMAAMTAGDFLVVA